jgi:hypothetical protein
MNRETTAKEKLAPIYLKLDAITVNNLAAPNIGQRTYLDKIVPSFGVRVSAGGAKTYIVQGRVRGEKHPTRLKVGRVGAIALAAARERARQLLAMMEAGKHPRVRNSPKVLSRTCLGSPTIAGAAPGSGRHNSAATET